MVKRQKEKQYQSATEHRLNSQLRSGSKASSTTTIRRLPFHCCALTLNPFTTPVCTSEGIIFENDAILPHILQYKSDPVTGNPMTSRDLIHLNLHKDDDGRWSCPVLNKPFGDYSKIVAIRSGQTANVFSYEAVEELNFKTKHYEDLLTGMKFDRKTDVIVLQDPKNEEFERLRDINHFAHVKEMRELRKKDTGSGNVKMSLTASRIMGQLEETKKKRDRMEADERKTKKKKEKEMEEEMITTEDVSGVKLTTGRCSASLTSTVTSVSNVNESREASKDEILNAQFEAMKKRKKKGYVRLHTNMGQLDLELHCDIVPRTTTNFLGLALQGFYDGSVFHRSIQHFMIQGGKPVGKKEETSLWGDAFVDEFDDRLKHSERGLLSMANSGPGTNKCQFFITYKSCNHLDRKHSVFGRVINGLAVLDAMEEIPTDDNDKPQSKIKIVTAEVLVDPAKEAEEMERKRIQERRAESRRVKEARKASALGRNKPTAAAAQLQVEKLASKDDSVGKYLPKNVLHHLVDEKVTSGNVKGEERASSSNTSKNRLMSRLPPPPKKTTFGDFSSW